MLEQPSILKYSCIRSLLKDHNVEYNAIEFIQKFFFT
jgi:hypothetical protein